MKNFDAFVGIDWSGAKFPVITKSIALSTAFPGDAPPVLHDGGWSRDKAASHILSLAEGKDRVLIGIDCNFGYSEITGIKQFGDAYTAPDLWQAVEAANHAEPNYFAGGYWTHPDHGHHFWQSGKMAEGFVMPRRRTEQVCGDSGLGWPESPFKLIGAKQVGKGGLAGMRLILDLKKRLGSKLAVWPFDEDTDKAMVVITEIYPRLFLRLTGHGNAKVRTLPQLNAALAALQSRSFQPTKDFSDHQADAIVSAAGLRFLCGTGKTVPDNLCHPPAPRQILAREGWIFGAGAAKTC